MTSASHVPGARPRSDGWHIRAAILIGLALFWFPGHPVVAATALDKEVTFNIAPQPLSEALLQFSRVAGVTIMSDSLLTEDRKSDGITGRLSAGAALTALLHGTELTFSINGTTVFVKPQESSARQSRLREGGTTSHQSAPSKEISKHGPDIEEVRVTGSLIRGAESASPSMQFSPEDIERAGSVTLNGFLRTLPQGFGGGVNETSATGEAAPGGSYTAGSGVNLRGLGNGASLVLMNGHRMAAAGLGDYVDISAIPMLAIERIDVQTDAEAALYGSDAVAGVVNVILWDHYNGAKSDVIYGYPTEGGGRELRASQVFGRDLDRERFVVAYEYYRRQPLDSSSRDFTANAPAPLYLLPNVKRNSLFLHGAKEFGVSTELSLDGLGSRRDYTSRSNTGGGAFPLATLGSVTQLGGTLGLKTDISSKWRLNASGNYTSAASPSRNFLLPADAQISDVDVRSVSKSLEASADGPLFWKLSSVRAALGAQIRRDTYDYSAGGIRFNASNYVTAVVGEAFIPFVSSDAPIPGIDALHASAVLRYEHHSHFGRTLNPQVGVVWYPTSTLQMRGTYGTSFRTPTLDETNKGPNGAAFVALSDPASTTGTTPTLVLTGNGLNLRPERARTWTGGLSWKAPSSDLKVALTYFDIVYRDRLTVPGNDLLSGLVDSGSLGSLVVRSPSPALLQQLSTQSALQSNEGNYALTDIGAVLDYRLQNLAEERLKGLDLVLTKAWGTSLRGFNAQLYTQYLFVHTRQATPAAPVTNLANVIFEPTRVRILGTSRWHLGALTSDIALSYSNGYWDNRSTPKVPIGSWTILNAGLSYDIGARVGSQWAQSLTASLYVTNVLDRSPPFVPDPTMNHVNFDGTQGSPIGRVVATRITKSW